MDSEKCPCCSGKLYSECCEPIIKGLVKAETPEALMRSRYAAYAKAEIDHLISSTAPSQRESIDREEMRSWAERSQWLGLEIISAPAPEAGDNRLDIDIVPVSFQFFSFRKNGVVFHDLAVNAVAVDLKFAERRIGCKCGDRRKRLLEFRRISGDDLRIHFIENHETLPGYLPQHFLYFLPLPQGHGALRSIFGAVRT